MTALCGGAPPHSGFSTGRLASASDLMGPYFLCLAEGQGKFYPEKSIVEWLRNERFTNISVKQLPFDEVFITAEKG